MPNCGAPQSAVDWNCYAVNAFINFFLALRKALPAHLFQLRNEPVDVDDRTFGKWQKSLLDGLAHDSEIMKPKEKQVIARSGGVLRSDQAGKRPARPRQKMSRLPESGLSRRRRTRDPIEDRPAQPTNVWVAATVRLDAEVAPIAKSALRSSILSMLAHQSEFAVYSDWRQFDRAIQNKTQTCM